MKITNQNLQIIDQERNNSNAITGGMGCNDIKMLFRNETKFSFLRLPSVSVLSATGLCRNINFKLMDDYKDKLVGNIFFCA